MSYTVHLPNPKPQPGYLPVMPTAMLSSDVITVAVLCVRELEIL